MSRITVNQEKLQALQDAERAKEIESRLREIDFQSIRSLRASIVGDATPEDTSKLQALESEATQIRAELAVKRKSG